MRFHPGDLINEAALKERWTPEDRARAEALLAQLKMGGVEELRLIPPDGLEARASELPTLASGVGVAPFLLTPQLETATAV